jgi:hypothetical protein
MLSTHSRCRFSVNRNHDVFKATSQSLITEDPMAKTGDKSRNRKQSDKKPANKLSMSPEKSAKAADNREKDRPLPATRPGQ